MPFVKDQKWKFITAFIAMLLTSAAHLIDPLILAHIIDVSVPNHDVADMFRWGGFFAFVIIISGLLSYYQIMTLAKAGVRIITKIKYEVFQHLTAVPISWFDKTPTGELISRIESDGERVKELFSNFSVMIFGNILFFIGMIFVMYLKDWKITTALLIPIVFVVVSAVFIIRYLSRFYRRSRVLNARVTGNLTEYIQGMSVVQLFNQQKKVEDLINKHSKEKQLVDTKASYIEYGLWGVFDFLIQTVFIITIILLTVPKVLNHVATIGTLLIFIQYSVRLFWPIMQITENINQIQRAFVSLNRMLQLLDLPVEEAEQEIVDIQFNHEIEFKDVWFKYKEDEWVLKGVSFKIKKGEKVALVGASGSGKTTTISLLCLFYKINKGQILVDGIDINSLNLKEWRKKTGLVLQDIVLFPGSLLDNVRIYNDEISEEQVLNAIDYVHAGDLLARLNNDLQFEIKERGLNLSMGEKQLLSFARALSFNPELIIMDEATASIDAKTEAQIQFNMDKLLHNKTAVIVAHRLSSVLNCDNIMVFDNGNIIAQGTHEGLTMSCPEYKKLVELQFLKKEA
ncbi:MAG: ABC transporter ATP-binding protein [Candidatus Cloacimonadales bacterium]|jgi:ATP-binding cassette subfamily B protein|nr:ABC transporter ATP-binding protein/permease [Candidatus Cloacimonadota bacterium]MDD2650360.1 ABC transporter ATP-binding protein [Candidatus Cloacimonadota bacterium]MDD3500835.1 ABC transporter ATP-binding protein [Candidatus Cloacimonadota bacterium]MDX9976830.1 ABC transporter ATP-binding protein [Candidatus Cloacimonadales bacterium]